MPICKTKFHGRIRFDREQVLAIPLGLIGFTDENEFLMLEVPATRPIVFVQSTRTPELCFISLPVQIIEGKYDLKLNLRDLKLLGYGNAGPRIGRDVLCLALLTIRDSETTANLLAPLVIDIRSHRGMQVIVRAYSHRHAFEIPRVALAC